MKCSSSSLSCPYSLIAALFAVFEGIFNSSEMGRHFAYLILPNVCLILFDGTIYGKLS